MNLQEQQDLEKKALEQFMSDKSLFGRDNTSLQRSWTQLHNFRFSFHFTADSREKSGKTPFPISIFEVKSALNPT